MAYSFPDEQDAERERRKRFNKVLTVVLATIAWIVLVCGLSLWEFMSSFCLDQQSCESVEHDGFAGASRLAVIVVTVLLTLGVLVLLPFFLGFFKTGAVYAVIALAIVVMLAQQEGIRDALRPDPGPTTEYELDPNQCIPRSGGDSECPGG